MRLRMPGCVRLGSLLLLMQSGALYASDCEFSPLEIFAGEDADIVLCMESYEPGFQITAGSAAEIIYKQDLRRCGVNDKRRGAHIVLNATNAGKASVVVSDQAGAPVCKSEVIINKRRALKEPEWLNAMPLEDARYIDVKGINTRYFDKGEGPVIVLVHGGQAGGSNNSAQKWEQNFYYLSQSYRVIALDRLAQAGTDNLSSSEAYADYFVLDAQHLEDFVDALGLKDVTLVGHSQGGWPVTRVALNRPELVSCLVNVDTVMIPDDMELMGEALAFLMYTSRFTNPASGPTVHSSRRSMAMRYPSGNNITQEKSKRVVDQFNSPTTAEARAGMKAARITPLHPSFKEAKATAYADIEAGKLTTRSVVLWGALDPQVPLGLGEQFDAMLVSAGVDTELVIIEGAGHAPFVEFPETFNELLLDSCGL